MYFIFDRFLYIAMFYAVFMVHNWRIWILLHHSQFLCIFVAILMMSFRKTPFRTHKLTWSSWSTVSVLPSNNDIIHTLYDINGNIHHVVRYEKKWCESGNRSYRPSFTCCTNRCKRQSITYCFECGVPVCVHMNWQRNNSCIKEDLLCSTCTQYCNKIDSVEEEKKQYICKWIQ